ncbi:hypothetical protein SDC9_111174 [bioreactor metagenome]|uniref:CDP-diacylglycerol--serine O-phosphatidyltransferase n=1 Tax=bioreactor metagenome TaxID=1076179 RepID=A0A645BGQ9_9ZZZZ
MLSGLCALVITLGPWYYIETAFYCILLAAAFDLFDGMVARILKVQSDFGKEFDSLCDVVSFGVAPAMITIRTLQQYMSSVNDLFGGNLVYFIAPLLFALAAGIRLAHFNTDTKQTKNFRGLPSPAAGLLLACTSLYWAEFYGSENVVLILSGTSLLAAALMLIPFPLLSLKLHNASNVTMAIVLLLLAVPSFLLLRFAAFTLLIISYIIASPLITYFGKLFSKTGESNS